MQPTPHDERPREARSKEACLGEALDWIVRLNRLSVSEAELLALEVWRARSATHAQAWHEALVLGRRLLPAAHGLSQSPPPARRRGAAGHPLIACTAGDIRITDRGAARGAASDISFPHYRRRQSWS